MDQKTDLLLVWEIKFKGKRKYSQKTTSEKLWFEDVMKMRIEDGGDVMKVGEEEEEVMV